MALLIRLKKSGYIQKIRISIRPDSLIKTCFLEKYDVDTIELGVPSMSERILALIQRGHSSETVEKAVRLCRQYGVEVGCQTMTALPESNREIELLTAEKIAALKPNFVRIHPTLVIQDTRLAQLYKNGKYQPQSLYEAVEEVAELVLFYRSKGIEIARLGFHVPEKMAHILLSGPSHPSFGMLVESEIRFQRMLAVLKDDPTHEIVLTIPRRELSYYIGYRKRNLRRFEEMGVKVKFLFHQS
jgi:histone acetyltransferase (RNA polymerase elongator complex component)